MNGLFGEQALDRVDDLFKELLEKFDEGRQRLFDSAFDVVCAPKTLSGIAFAVFVRKQIGLHGDRVVIVSDADGQIMGKRTGIRNRQHEAIHGIAVNGDTVDKNIVHLVKSAEVDRDVF